MYLFLNINVALASWEFVWMVGCYPASHSWNVLLHKFLLLRLLNLKTTLCRQSDNLTICYTIYIKINSELHLVRTEDMLAVMEGCCSSSVLKGKIDRAAGLGCLKEVRWVKQAEWRRGEQLPIIFLINHKTITIREIPNQ